MLTSSNSSPLPRVELPENYRQLGKVDVDALLSRVAALTSDDWEQGTRNRKNPFTGLEETRTLTLRFVTDLDNPLSSYSLPEFEDWKHLILPIVDEAARSYGYANPTLSKVMLTVLPAGKSIKPHIDARRGNWLTHKIHVPLVTHEDVKFFSKGVPFHIPFGEAWEVNNVDMHSVVNNSSIDRIHLIFEIFDAACLDSKCSLPK